MAARINSVECGGWSVELKTASVVEACFQKKSVIAVAPLPEAGATSPRSDPRDRRGAAGGPLARSPVRKRIST